MERYTISITNTNFLTVAVLSLTIFALLTIHNPSFGVGNANFTALNLTNTTMASQTPQPGEGTTNFTNPMLADPDRINMTNTTAQHSGMHSMMNTMTAPPPTSLSANNTLPIPSGERIFTPDKANIMKVLNDPLVIELVQVPKVVAAGEPVTFVLNLYNKNGSWLWHSDFDVSVTNAKTGEKMLSMPNIHGHGSMAQYSYVFPSAGTYTVSVTSSQQVNSPNYIQPHDVRKAEFAVNVVDSENTESKQDSVTAASTATQAAVKDVYVDVFSWGFKPNKIEVDQGDLVRLHFKTVNDEVSLYNGHGFGIEGYNVNTFLVKGTDQTVEFIADKPGTFTFRCTSFCSLPDAPESAHFNMVGQFIVNQKANQ